MIDYEIDNSVEADLNRVITWQYDQATKLCSIIGTTETAGVKTRGLLPQFFFNSTEELWDAIAEKINIASPTECDDYGLSVWGKLLGVPRPSLSFTSGGTTIVRKMSRELYRRILVGRLRLAMSNASVDAYVAFLSYVFTDGTNVNVRVVDNGNMSISFAYTKLTNLTDYDPDHPNDTYDIEQKNVVENLPDAVFAYPAGVKSATENDGPVFGFFEQVRDANGVSLSTNVVIDDQSVDTKSYTYTKNGYTYTKTHKDFKIANLDHGTIAWDRFAG